MVWEIHPAAQVVTYLWSLLLGVLLCVWYDFFRLIRRRFRCSVWRIALQDLFFWLVAAVATFLFLLARENGRIRLFVLLGAGIGFALWRVTVGAVLLKAAEWILGLFLRCMHRILHLFACVFRPFAAIFRKVGIFFKKKQKIFTFRRKNS